jgi:hypothetical protein
MRCKRHYNSTVYLELEAMIRIAAFEGEMWPDVHNMVELEPMDNQSLIIKCRC